MRGGAARQTNMSSSSSHFDLVVLAASAGGLKAITAIVAGLPAAFPVPLAIVLHRSKQLPNMLAQVLGHSTALIVRTAETGDRPTPGTIYLAPSDRHLTITHDGAFALMDEQLIHHTHSAADPLFRSAADVFGNRLVAIVLTGGCDDGAEGARSVGLAGGVVIAQNQATSQVFSMPQATIATGQVDSVLGIEDIGPALTRLVETGSLGS
jgi:two-component system, chemotaxis family, protein-glutamate methylesterase/glutaminase